MIIAIPLETGKRRISEHFGRAGKFLLVRFESGEILGSEIVDAPPHAFGAFPQFLADHGVRVVVCQNIGEKAKELLKNQGIHVFSGFSGNPEEAIDGLVPKIREMEEAERKELEKREKARKALEKAREKMVNFWVDVFPVEEGKKEFFVSVDVGNGLFLSFDKTKKGNRVIIQRVLGEEKNIELPEKPSGEWVSVHFYGSRVMKSEKVKWWDLGKIDVINDEVLETIWEDELPDDISEKIWEFAKYVCDHSDDLSSLDKSRVREFNDFLRDLVSRYSHAISSLQN